MNKSATVSILKRFKNDREHSNTEEKVYTSSLALELAAHESIHADINWGFKFSGQPFIQSYLQSTADIVRACVHIESIGQNNAVICVSNDADEPLSGSLVFQVNGFVETATKK